MGNFKRFFQQRKLLMKMIFSYVAVGTILIGIFAYIVIDKVSMNLTRDVNESVERATEQSYNTADILLSSTYHYFASVFERDETLSNAMYGDTFDSLGMYRISTLLSSLKAANPLIDSIYIYNINHNYVFSSQSIYSTTQEFYDSEMTAILTGDETFHLGNFIPRNGKGPYDKTETKLISMIYTEFAGKADVDGALVVNLKQQTLQDLVSKGSPDTSFQSLIVNNQGEIISHTDVEKVNLSIADQPYIRAIQQSNSMHGNLNETIEGTSFFLSYVKADKLGWTFIGMAENENLLVKVNSLKSFIFWLTVIFVAAALLTALLSVNLIYTPLNRLIKRIGTSQAWLAAAASPLNEYEVLTRSFQYLENKVSDLQYDLSDSLPARKKELLRSLFRGSYFGSLQDERLKDVGIRLEQGYCQVCILRIDNYEQRFLNLDMADISLFKYALSNIAEEILRGTVNVETWDDNDDSIVLLLNGENPNTLTDETLLTLMKEIQDNVQRFLSISLTVSAGPAVGSLEEITTSWNRAYRTSLYRMVQGDGVIMFWEEEGNLKEAYLDHDYPAALEKSIADKLRAGEKYKLRDTAGEFFGSIRAYPYDEIMLYVYQLSVMALRVAKGMVDSEILVKSGMMSLPETIRKRDTLTEMEQEFCAFCEMIIDLRNQGSSHTNVKVVSLIKDKIMAEFSDPNLYVENLAEQIGLSTNYARKIFKDLTGSTISQFIADTRFQEAQRLLVETDLPAARIGEMVGIANTNYFYSSFKKYTGKSPVHYRKDHMLESQG